LLCLGVQGTRKKCKNAKNGSGAPVALNRCCRVCDEQRCKAHCKCKRRDSAMAEGRHAPRGHTKERAQVEAAAPARAPGCQQSAPSLELLEVGDWYRRCCEDIDRAAKVEVASYVYDNPSVQAALVKRLMQKKRRPFELTVYVDAELHREGSTKMQKSRLRLLMEKGACIWLCRGRRGLGVYHCKGLVVDRRALYFGSANFTTKSGDNGEWCFRATGPVVGQVLQRLAQDRANPKHYEWDGR
jgi:hypothetical protein